MVRAVPVGELQECWFRLRGEYLRVMVEAGCERDVVSARLMALEAERQARCKEQSDRWLDRRRKSTGSRRKAAAKTLGTALAERKIMRLLSRWQQADGGSRKRKMQSVQAQRLRC
eukprot:TRINITY_DN88980_c0_g1_i1.p1 TRINITY_DN88980_c0_g1~~TRINITY_DN88980_c0_g1_i1.p1  ORF type:complete len:115 (-),score=23.00 TRINITY_DN88980_c0_g1_i1:51-395(-)